MLRLMTQTAAIVIILSSPLWVQQLPREQWGAPQVSVSHAEGKWIIEGRKNKVLFNESDFALSIVAGPVTWTMTPSGPNDMLVKSHGEEFPLRFADAGKIDIVPCDTGAKTGVKITLAQWRHYGAALDLMLFLTICFEGADDDLVFDVAGKTMEIALNCEVAGLLRLVAAGRRYPRIKILTSGE
jgi:hypothetical protein